MRKSESESFHEYKARVIDPKSASFCGAKWHNATIWLGHGQTTSCHQPPPHDIPLEELKDNRIIKLSSYFDKYTLNFVLDFLQNKNFRNTKVVDARINNQIIITD